MTAWLDTLLFGILSLYLPGRVLHCLRARFGPPTIHWSGLLAVAVHRQPALGQQPVPSACCSCSSGHTFGMLNAPNVVYEHFIGAGNKQLMAMVSGGIAGVLGFVGVTILLHRRLSDPRIRATSRPATSFCFRCGCNWRWPATIPLSAQHLDVSMMMKLSQWSQRIVTFRSGGGLLADAGWIFKTPHVPGHEHLPDLPVHPPGARGAALARWPMCCALPGGACTPHEPPAGHMQSQDRRA